LKLEKASQKAVLTHFGDAKWKEAGEKFKKDNKDLVHGHVHYLGKLGS